MEFNTVLVFKDLQYAAEFKAGGECFVLRLTEVRSQAVWAGNFSGKNIEVLTMKAGNVKTFAVFCKLLVSALQNNNSSLHLDFYSYNELESLRNVSKSHNNSQQPAKKRYLIITYTTDFDKVHYPLPLNLQETHTERPELASRHTSEASSENSRLKHENAKLIKSLQSFKEEFANYQQRTERKIEELTSVKRDLEGEIQRMKEELDLIIDQLESEAKKKRKEGGGEMKAILKGIEKGKEENIKLKQEIARCRREIDDLRKNDSSNKKVIGVLNSRIEQKAEQDSDSIVYTESPDDSAEIYSHDSNESQEFRAAAGKLKHVLIKGKQLNDHKVN